MSSRLAFAPRRANASFATSRIRARFRWASIRGVRGFRWRGFRCFWGSIKTVATGGGLRLSYVLRRHSPFYSRCGGLSIANSGPKLGGPPEGDGYEYGGCVWSDFDNR